MSGYLEIARSIVLASWGINPRDSGTFAQVKWDYNRLYNLLQSDEDHNIDMSIYEYLILYSNLPKALKSDPEIASAAIMIHPSNIKIVPESVKSDPNLMLNVVEKNSEAFKLLPETLQNDKKFAVNAVLRNAEIYKYLHYDLQADEEIMLIALYYSKNYLRPTDLIPEKLSPGDYLELRDAYFNRKLQYNTTYSHWPIIKKLDDMLSQKEFSGFKAQLQI